MTQETFVKESKLDYGSTLKKSFTDGNSWSLPKLLVVTWSKFKPQSDKLLEDNSQNVSSGLTRKSLMRLLLMAEFDEDWMN